MDIEKVWGLFLLPLVGLIMTLVGWMWKQLTGRVDKISERVDNVEAELEHRVTTDQLNQTVGALRESIDKSENRTTTILQKLTDKVDRQTDAMIDAQRENSKDVQSVLKLIAEKRN